MKQIEAMLSNMANAPKLLEIIREVPEEFCKRRPSLEKWSAHEHACHLAEVHPLFYERLNLMLAEDNPVIKSYRPDAHDAPDLLLNRDLDEALERFAADRGKLLERLRGLSPEEWQRTARHEEYSHYSIFIMFRHLALHDYLHIYRIEELLLKKDWN